ncbi:MAG: PorT family protein [Bacteroidetes bacterium]|nr:PorT family protein [Bacteroidota bacterium]
MAPQVNLNFRLYFSVMLILISLFAKAQEEVQPVSIFSGGITVGGNVSQLIGDAYSGFHKLGWNVGPVVDVRLYSVLHGNMEFLYSQRGCRGVRQINSQYVGAMFEKYYVDLNYFEVPIQLIVQYKPKWNVGAGISYSRLIKSKEDLYSDQPYNLDSSLFAFQNEDWAFLVGGSYQFFKNWSVNLRYQQSFRPIRNWYQVPVGLGSGNQFNSWFTLKLIYLFSFSDQNVK